MSGSTPALVKRPSSLFSSIGRSSRPDQSDHTPFYALTDWHTESNQQGHHLQAEFDSSEDEQDVDITTDKSSEVETYTMWLCDNMYLQCLGAASLFAIILPRVQDHFDVPASQIGTLTACMMVGMMIGAVAWGSAADIWGRTIPFNATLALTGLFGLLSSYARGFTELRISVLLLGSAVGGSMPTDGTIFLENMPRKSQYLLTGLSVFFSLGAVISSLIGLWILPGSSCPEHSPSSSYECSVETDNLGWRYMLRTLGAITIIMFLLRLFAFRLYESPRYLLATHRKPSCVQALCHIISVNGRPDLIIHLETSEGRSSNDGQTGLNRTASRDQEEVGRREANYVLHKPAGDPEGQEAGRTSIEHPERGQLRPSDRLNRPGMIVRLGSRSPLRQPSEPPKNGRGSGVDWRVGWRKTVKKLKEIWKPEWRLTTGLMCVIWGAMSLAYTMFNAFLPILLEDRVPEDSAKGGRIEALQELVLYTLAGCPGALIGAYLVETTFGRRKSLAGLTALTSLATTLFSLVSSKSGVVWSSCAISISGTAMYAVLYGMTPEIFETDIRGTACGTSAAVSRLAGIVAPLLTGKLLSIKKSSPMWVSSGVFVVALGCTLLLPFERAEDNPRGSNGGRVEYDALALQADGEV
ncbi:Synaptic vesicle transporter SV2 (major facilitator superfamily) [Phaffia rhodozyma]|uniref:Synaptic vesicle transporter SV2 (Major facilitator superfamily) n=1 Tax=Phaffia rhodozyma TaxID=264483 RepID=A0A0F7SUL9_PHARH|nr:Synaptic vesicle transporter SV2 (major facilitator superfamily) [Phaffia rhodozyma]